MLPVNFKSSKELNFESKLKEHLAKNYGKITNH